MSSSSSDEEALSPNSRMEKKAKGLMQNLLPPNSRAIYLKAYQNFMDWKREKGVESNSEGIFLNYFDELAKKYKSSTLWSVYSMLKTTMQLKHEVDLKTYRNLTSLLKRASCGFKPKKSKVFTAQDIENFLNDAPNEKYLATKVALIFGISGACRGIELANITVEDVETDTTLQAINLPHTKTNKERKFVICGVHLNIVKMYQKLRPTNVTTNRFFLNYKNGKCTKQVIGKNKFAKMPKEIATFLALPDPNAYTGHCFRRTSATLLADSGANILTLKRHGGWRSDQVAEGYVEDSLQNKRNITELITKEINVRKSNEPQPSTSREPQPSTSWYIQPTSEHDQHHTSDIPFPENPSPQLCSPTFTTQQTSPSFTPQPSLNNTNTNINLPGKAVNLNIKNCSNCTFNFS